MMTIGKKPLPHPPAGRRGWPIRLPGGLSALLLATALQAALSPADLARIEAALPREAPAKPREPRRLLIFDRNVNYGGHASIPFANQAFRRMGEVTGAFATEVSSDPEVFRPANLARFDAVFLNNNVGNLFTDPALRNSLGEFVWSGGGLLGVHGTTVAFTQWPGAIEDWPEFAYLLGARGANHRENKEHVCIKLDDPDHPVNAVFGGRGWDYRDEFFRVHEPFSRQRLRVLFSIDTARTDLAQGRGFGRIERADGDYALAWVKPHGRGRVFYCTIAHHPEVFEDPRLLQFYLAAVQFVMGDLPGPVEPSAPRRFTGPSRQEDTAWRLRQMKEFRNRTLFDQIQRAAELGQTFLAVSGAQWVSAKIRKSFGPGLSAEERAEVRLALARTGLRITLYAPEPFPADPDKLADACEFARRLGVTTLAVPSPAPNRALLEKLCAEWDLTFHECLPALKSAKSTP